MTEVERRWQVVLPRQVEKTLYRLPKPVLQRIDRALLTLVENPYPAESHPLAGYYDLYRLPVEEWRITYTVEEERRIVLILELVPRQQPERYRLEEETDESVSTPHRLVSPERTDALLAHLEKFREEHLYDFYRTALGNFVKQTRQEKIRLLIVDDLVETRENLRKLLYFESDIEVVGAATNGEEAIQMTVELQPDVVLMDILMPGIDGITATEKISQQVPTAQVIMMSVHGEADYLRRAMLAGAKEFLIKPFSQDELITSIRRVYQTIALSKRHLGPIRDAFKDLKTRLQNKLLAELNPKVDILGPDEARRTLQEIFDRILAQENIVFSRSERERLFEGIAADILGFPLNQALEQNETELDETQKRTLAQWFKFYKLGHHLEITLSVADLPESLNFYEKLGLTQVDGGEEPFPWAVVSDGRFHLGLHQQVFSSPTLSYFAVGILSERMVHLVEVGIKLDKLQQIYRLVDLRNSELIHRLSFATAEFESPEGQRVLLADVSSEVETTPAGRKFFSKYGTCGELSLKTEAVKAAVTYWEQLGFECVAEGNQPYPWAVVSDGLIRLGFHQTPKLAKPTLTYFAPNMPDRLERLHQQSLKFIAEYKDKQGRRVGAMIESPDGQPLLLFTGEFKFPHKEVNAAKAQVSSQAEQEIWTPEKNRLQPEDARWYLIYSHLGNELEVRQSLLHRITAMGLRDKIFQVVVPPDPSISLQISGSSFLSGSLLVQMIMDEDAWYVVKNAPGVTGFGGTSDKPTPLSPAEVERIFKRTSIETFSMKINLEVGQKVRIVEGPFEDFLGIVDEVDPDQAKVKVRVSFFGQEKSVHLDLSQVERI